MGKVADELFERSKNDQLAKMIVGSEIRAAIDELRQALSVVHLGTITDAEGDFEIVVCDEEGDPADVEVKADAIYRHVKNLKTKIARMNDQIVRLKKEVVKSGRK